MAESSWLRRHEDERLSAFLDDELPEDEALRVTRHLAACAACMSELEGLRRARRALRGLPNVDPPSNVFLDAAFAAAVGVGDRWPVGTRVLVAALAGTIALLGGAFVLGGESDGTVAPPVELFVVDHVVRVGGGPVITSVDLGTAGR